MSEMLTQQEHLPERLPELDMPHISVATAASETSSRPQEAAWAAIHLPSGAEAACATGAAGNALVRFTKGGVPIYTSAAFALTAAHNHHPEESRVCIS